MKYETREAGLWIVPLKGAKIDPLILNQFIDEVIEAGNKLDLSVVISMGQLNE